MNTQWHAAMRRRWLAASTLLLLSIIAAPAMAQNCTGFANSLAVDPASQIAQEFNAGSNYGPVTVTLTIRNTTSLPAGTTLVWTQTGGPAVSLNHTNPVRPTFIAPSVGAAGATLGFSVQARCNGLSVGNPALASVTILNVDRPPSVTALASPPIADAGDVVTLSATGSDPDGDAITYTWTQIANGAPVVSLGTPGAASTTFVAPTTPVETTLEFRVEARAGTLAHTANVTVTVTAMNLPPYASLSCPLEVDEGEGFRLDGTDSEDPEGAPLTYEWFIEEIEVGLAFSLDGESGAFVDRVAPSLGLGMSGGVVVRLRVSESPTVFSDATCAFMVMDATAPVIDGAGDRTVDATSPAGANVDYGLTATDNVEGDVTPDLACVPPSGSAFGLNVPTDVNCEVRDTNENLATKAFVVTVRDLTKPVIDAHDDVAVEAEGPLTPVSYDPPGTFDVVDIDLVATCDPPSGTPSAVGSHTITCNATDTSGNVADPKTFKVTVHDTTKPIVTVPADIVAEATSALGAAVSFSVTAFDIVDLAIPATCDANSDDVFPLGETTVHCSATDAHLNTGTASFKITVQDTTNPTLSLPSTITEEATSPDGAVVGYLATATDTVDPSVDVVCEPPSGSTFPLGTTTVDCTATDDAGNTAEGSFDVIVEDTTPPTLSELLDITAEATGPGGAAASWTVTASDLVSGDVDVTCTPTSGSTFALGSTTVECSATDDANNTSTDTFTVTVRDTTPPTLSLPASFSEEATGPNGATVNFTATASDLVDGNVPVTCSPLSGSVFALGAKLVQCSAEDAASNEASGAFTVTIVDTRPPTLVVPADKIVEATSPSGAAVSFITSATDIVDTDVAIVCTPASGSTFALGSHTVSCTATDDSGNQDTDSFNVLVRDTTAPALHLPASFTKEATSAAGAVATFTATADDVVDSSVIPVCVLPSGSTFALGANTVSCTATDDANNATSDSFTITVVDTTAPVVASHPDVTVTATSNSSAIATWTNPTASDAVDGNNLATTCVPPSGSSFSVGATNLITCSVTDQAGNTGTGTFHVIVKYAFAGFFSPVDNLPTVNTVKAGQAIPVKFSLGGNQGMSIFFAGYPKSTVMSCGGSAQDAIEETLTAGSSTLTYDAGTGRYHYVWKTDKAWGGTCRQLQVKFADGTTQVANFNFTR